MSPDKGRPTDFQTKCVDLSKHGPPPGSAFAFFCAGGVDPVVSLGPKSRILLSPGPPRTRGASNADRSAAAPCSSHVSLRFEEVVLLRLTQVGRKQQCRQPLIPKQVTSIPHLHFAELDRTKTQWQKNLSKDIYSIPSQAMTVLINKWPLAGFYSRLCPVKDGIWLIAVTPHQDGCQTGSIAIENQK